MRNRDELEEEARNLCGPSALEEAARNLSRAKRAKRLKRRPEAISGWMEIAATCLAMANGHKDGVRPARKRDAPMRWAPDYGWEAR